MLGERLQAIVAVLVAAVFHAHFAHGQVQLIMNHNDPLSRHPQLLCKGSNGLTGEVHECLGFDYRGAVNVRQRISHHEAHVVPCRCVFLARVAKANHQPLGLLGLRGFRGLRGAFPSEKSKHTP